MKERKNKTTLTLSFQFLTVLEKKNMNKKQLKKIRRTKLLKKKANIQRSIVTKQNNLQGYSAWYQNEVLPKSRVAIMDVMTGKVTELEDVSDELLDSVKETERMLPEIYNNHDTMIHENDFIPHDCVLCGSEIKSIHNSNNPFPLTEVTSAKGENGKESPQRSCNACENTLVLPARIRSLKEGTHKDTWKKIHDGSIYRECA